MPESRFTCFAIKPEIVERGPERVTKAMEAEARSNEPYSLQYFHKFPQDRLEAVPRIGLPLFVDTICVPSRLAIFSS